MKSKYDIINKTYLHKDGGSFMIFGYIRPSNEYSEEYQFVTLQNLTCDKIFIEKHASANNRTQLKNMVESLEPGDKIIILKLYLLADSTHHLLELLDKIEEKGAFIQSIKEGIDTSSENGYPFSYVVNHLAAFQSEVVSERTKQGLKKAKEKGIVTGRPRLPDENVKRAINMYYSKKYSLAEIRDETGISKSTLYRYLES